MPAVKSKNRINVFINKNFVIRVQVIENKLLVGKSKLTSANKLSNYILDEELKIRLFKKVMEAGMDKHTFKIRSRLKIDFVAK